MEGGSWRGATRGREWKREEGKREVCWGEKEEEEKLESSKGREEIGMLEREEKLRRKGKALGRGR